MKFRMLNFTDLENYLFSKVVFWYKWEQRKPKCLQNDAFNKKKLYLIAKLRAKI